MIGRRFGRLLVLGYMRRGRAGKSRWFVRCLCTCGKMKPLYWSLVARSVIVSCGCYRADRVRRHGHAGKGRASPEYRAWCAMLFRCNNPKANSYERYGGRGIKVCREWHQFDNFLKDVGLKPSPEHQLDRINNNGNYKPGNVRWVTRSVQCVNRRSNKMVRYRGQTKPLSVWCNELELPYSRTAQRLGVLGWSVEKAFS